jgi:hypothetical protein
MIIRVGKFFLVVVCLLLISLPAAAQKITGDIVGTVSDSSGAQVPDATVTVESVGTSATRTTTTSATGAYRVSDLTTGSYKISITAAGFKTALSTVEISSGGVATADFTLQIGERTETVQVEGSAPLVDLSANNNNYVDNDKIENVPLNGRDFNSLIAMTPGVQRAPGGGFMAISINGSRTSSNNYLIDGLYNNDRYYGDAALGQTGVLGVPAAIFPPEALQEVGIQETPSAEFGVKGGAPISLVMKSGTNSFHGTAQWVRHTSFADASNYFSKINGCDHDPGTPNPCDATPIRNQQFGGTLGGPLWKDKTFFFVFYEGQREATISTRSQQVFTPAEVTAAEAAITNAGQTPSAAGLALLSFVPVSDSGQFLAQLPTTDKMDSFGVKVDHRFNARHSIAVKYIYGDSVQSAPCACSLPPAAPNPQDFFNSVAPSRTQLAGINYNWNIGNNKVFESRLGWTRFAQIIKVNDNKVDPKSLGVDTGPLDPTDFGVPYVYFGNFGYGSSIGGVQGYPITTRPDQTFDWSEHLSWTKGNHGIKLGGNYQTAYTNSLRNRARTGFGFGYASSYENNGAPITNNVGTLEELLLSKTEFASRNFGDTRRHIRQKAFGLYAQDDWKIRPRLTLTLGLRWELNTPISEEKNLAANFIPGRGLVRVGDGISSLYNYDKTDFGPHVGFAWDIFGKGKTALRGGYSLTYDVPNFGTIAAPYTFSGARAGAFTQPFQGAQSSNSVGISIVPLLDPADPTGNTTLPVDPLNLGCTDPETNSNPGFVCYDNTPVFGSSPTGSGPFNAYSVARNFKTPSAHSLNLSIQHQLTENQVVTIGYSGSFGQNLVILRDLNASPLGGDGTRPYDNVFFDATTGTPDFKHIIQATNLGYSRYNSLQASFSQRNWHGFNMSYNYTFSNCHDTNSINRGGTGVGVGPQLENPLNVDDMYGFCDHDVRQNFNIAGLYRAPTFPGPAVIGRGWELSSVFTALGGRPFTALIGTSDPSGQGLNGSGPSVRADYDGSPIQYHTRNPNQYVVETYTTPGQADPCGDFNGGAGGLPLSPFYVPCPGTVGNSRRNMLRGPGLAQLDMSLIKNTKIGEHVTAQFRWEVYNVLNRANFATFVVNNSITTSSFATISNTPDVAVGNPVVAQGGPRSMNFALKFIF